MAICGPKLSLCCMMLSAWGVLQLGLMGVFYFTKSLAFVKDVVAELPNKTSQGIAKFYEDLDDGYTQGAYNCWIAAAMYFVVLIISALQFRANNRI